MKTIGEPMFGRWLPALFVALFAGILLMSMRTPVAERSFDVPGFSELPVLNGGRLKPLDTVARTALLELSGKQTVRVEKRSLSAMDWLLDVMFRPDVAANYPVFQIDDPDVLGLMGIQQKTQRLFRWADIEPHAQAIDQQSTAIAQLKPETRSRFQTAVTNFEERITLYQKLQNTLQVAGSDNVQEALRHFREHVLPELQSHMASAGNESRLLGPLFQEFDAFRFLNHVAEFFPVPLKGASWDPNRWVSFGRAVLDGAAEGYPPAVTAYAAMSDQWRAGDPLLFNQTLGDFRGLLQKNFHRAFARAQAEVLFNRMQLFYQSLMMYLVVFLFVFLSWIFWPQTLNRTAYALLVLAFSVHTVGLVSRMVLQGRPPVTNLYSSAIFVGWIAVLLGIVLERLYRNGIGSMVASTIGFLTLIIAHHLASSGDTLEMMRAVLDSNFWLATHVVSITIGYGSTFLAGFIGILYLFRRILDRRWTLEEADALERMAYGIVCFAMFFSFVGTILGGIWADQSWGRFWGWDPKENGALMIVLWNAWILHARWGTIAKGRVFMALTVFGNIVTSLSWFGVNMLGIGLHSYGFMDKTFHWLLAFIISQLAIVLLAWVPVPWRSGTRHSTAR